MSLDINNEEITNLQEQYDKIKTSRVPLPVIKVFGVGGAGCHALDRFKKQNNDMFQNIIMVSVNTDLQDLYENMADIKLQIGPKATGGNGAGARPEVGEISANESRHEIEKLLQGTNLLFLTAGMGGGTGTGAVPVIAQIAREMGILTIAVVSKPFLFEGAKRAINAERGIDKLKNFVDVLLIIPNQKLPQVYKEASICDTFEHADRVLKNGILSIADLILHPGLINLDFADVESITRNKGNAHMGIGSAEGEGAIFNAIQSAVSSPLLDTGIEGAKGLIVNLKGDGRRIRTNEIDDAMGMLKDAVAPDCNIVWGIRNCPDWGSLVEITLIATEFDEIATRHEDQISNYIKNTMYDQTKDNNQKSFQENKYGNQMEEKNIWQKNKLENYNKTENNFNRFEKNINKIDNYNNMENNYNTNPFGNNYNSNYGNNNNYNKMDNSYNNNYNGTYNGGGNNYGGNNYNGNNYGNNYNNNYNNPTNFEDDEEDETIPLYLQKLNRKI